MLDPYNPKRFLKPVAILTGLAVIAVFYGMIGYFGVNIPYWDEYDIVLRFLEYFENAESASEKWQLLYQLSNEHRILLYKALVVLEKNSFGDIDFRRMMWLGNTGTLLILWLLWKSFDVKRYKLLYFLPVVLLLVVCIWERSTWACASFLNTYVILFAFAALYFLSKNGGKYLALALVFSVLATFSFGNGLFVFPAGFFTLWLKKRPVRDYLVWGGAMVMIAGIYFLDYTRASNPSSFFMHANPVLLIGYICSFTGAVFKYITPYLAPFAGLALLLVLSGSALYHFKDRQQHTLLWSFMLFLLVSILAAAVSRSGEGPGQAISYRYELIPSLIMAILYLFFLKILPKKQVLLFSLMVAGLLYAARIQQNVKECGYFKERLENGLILFHAGDPSYLSGLFEQRTQLGRVLERFIAAGHYHSPIEELTTLPSYRKLGDIPQESERVKTKLYISKDNAQFYFIKGWAYVNGMQTHDATIEWVLKKPEGNAFVFETQPVLFRYLTEQYGYGYYLDKAGFKIVLDKRKLSMLPGGPYEAGVLITNEGQVFYKRLQDISLQG